MPESTFASASQNTTPHLPTIGRALEILSPVECRSQVAEGEL